MSADEQIARDIVCRVVDEVVEQKESDTLNPSILACRTKKKKQTWRQNISLS